MQVCDAMQLNYYVMPNQNPSLNHFKEKKLII